MKVADHHGLEELAALERREPVTRRRVRLRTLVLAKRGKTAPQIVEALGISRRSVQRVVERYNRQGLAVLDDRAAAASSGSPGIRSRTSAPGSTPAPPKPTASARSPANIFAACWSGSSACSTRSTGFTPCCTATVTHA